MKLNRYEKLVSESRAWKHGLLLLFLTVIPLALQAQPYDLVIKGGHLIDPRHNIDEPMDLAIHEGSVARVAKGIPADEAAQIIDATGLYVTPGLIDVHAHVFSGSQPGRFADGFNSVSPDGFTFRNGITTVVDPGSAGWRTFDTFREQVISPSETRILAFLNLVGYGLYGTEYNNDRQDMDPDRTLKSIREHRDLIVGVRFGHYNGADYLEPLDTALRVAEEAGLPFQLECNLPNLDVEEVLERMRPGDQFTHSYEPGRRSLLDEEGRIYDFVWEARRRGVLFDVGHGGASFRFTQAVPSVQQGFWPDTFGTDLHRYSINDGMKNMLNVMSKFMAMGMELSEVIERATWRAAQSIQREDLGHLGVGAVADVALLNRIEGSFGFVDAGNFRLDGSQKLITELTLREGEVVWDLNGLAARSWTLGKP
ncbi:MAG: amidohydrolase/deacetylase family metallohydrolase [Balneolaceae bacterium]